MVPEWLQQGPLRSPSTLQAPKRILLLVVDMVAFDCILNPVVNWRTKKLLLPGIDGPTEVELNHDTCRSRVSNVSLLSTAQLLKICIEGSPLYLATIRPTYEVADPSVEDDLNPTWRNLVGKFGDVFQGQEPHPKSRRDIRPPSGRNPLLYPRSPLGLLPDPIQGRRRPKNMHPDSLRFIRVPCDAVRRY
jgi:hypothetical protein